MSLWSNDRSYPPVDQVPLSAMENETVHLHDTRLRLTDFEVRDMLGLDTFGRVLLTEIIQLHQIEQSRQRRRTHFISSSVSPTSTWRCRTFPAEISSLRKSVGFTPDAKRFFMLALDYLRSFEAIPEHGESHRASAYPRHYSSSFELSPNRSSTTLHDGSGNLVHPPTRQPQHFPITISEMCR
ncbi:hypothetical protein PM082_011860 [Marasmius tenuissimus]|nr:hypothetical protein PM082_011860 [Marasmius tenuissimus]